MNFIFLLALIACLLASNEPAGFYSSLTTDAIVKIQQAFLPLLESQFSSITVPDIHTRVDTGILGHADVDITKIVVDVKSWGSIKVSFTDSGISARISGFSMKGSLHWRYELGFVSDSGTADIDVNSVSISGTIGLSDHNGELVLDMPSCAASIGDIDIDFHGSWVDWLYECIADLAEGSIKDAIEDSITDELPDAVEDVSDDVLAEFDYNVAIDDDIYISSYLTQNPVTTSEELSVSLEGRFGAINDPSFVYPLTIVPRILDDGRTTAVRVGITEDCPNSLLAVLDHIGKLSFGLDNDDLPDSFTDLFPLDIDTLAAYLPELRDMFPEDLTFSFLLEPTEGAAVPTIQFSDDFGIRLNALGTLSAIADDAASSVLFQLGLEFDLGLKPELISDDEGVYLCAEFSLEYMDISTISSITGDTSDIDLSDISDLVNYLFNDAIIPLFNALFEAIKGIPLPVIPGVELINSSFLYDSGIMQIATDFNINL